MFDSSIAKRIRKCTFFELKLIIADEGHWPELYVRIVESRRSISQQQFCRSLRRVPDAAAARRDGHVRVRTQVCGNVLVAGAAASAEAGRQPRGRRRFREHERLRGLQLHVGYTCTWPGGCPFPFFPPVSWEVRHNKRVSFTRRWILIVKSNGLSPASNLNRRTEQHDTWLDYSVVVQGPAEELEGL